MKKLLSISACLTLFCSSVFAQLGTIDPSLNLGTGFGNGLTTSRVETIIQQVDGKLLVGGWFVDYNGTEMNRIARLNLDGSLDNTFNIGEGFTGVSAYVNCMAIQPDGKILVGGNFLSFNGVTRHRIARLNSNGSLDTSFDPLTGFNSDVNSIAIQADGKIVVVGIFSHYDWLNNNSIEAPSIIRLNPDGSKDDSFNPLNAFNKRVHILPDGKILTAGSGIRSFDGVERMFLARLNANGSLDESFDIGTNFNLVFGTYGSLNDMKVLANGKIMIAGNFQNIDAGNSGLARFNADGSFDNTLQLSSFASTLGIQADGKFLICEIGPFNIKRYNENGELDSTFPVTTLNSKAQCIMLQTDGNIVLGGWFSYNPSGMMRLIGDNPTTDVQKLKTSSIKVAIYPNPANSQINIKIEDLERMDGLKLKLINAIGQVVQTLDVNATLMTFTLEKVQAGAYIYQLESREGVLKVGKLIVE